jgi:MerR family mercuric resistance operon transcriptional regulator
MLVSVAIRRYVPPVAITGSRKIVMAAATKRTLSRGELARRTGVNSETIRYFERIGILSTPERTEGGHRVYDDGHVRTLSFIRRARGLGFAPEEVRAIVNLGGPGKACCAEVQEIAERHLEQVRAKIADLLYMERLLAATVERCSGASNPDCPVIDMIEHPQADHNM